MMLMVLIEIVLPMLFRGGNWERGGGGGTSVRYLWFGGLREERKEKRVWITRN